MRERFSRKEFLDALFGDYFRKHDGFLIVRSTKHLDRRVSTRFFPSVEILAKEQYQQDQDVYMGVCPRQSMKPERPDIRWITALWSGVDLAREGYSGKDSYFENSATAAKAVRSFPMPPSVIVESGHGMHLYWLLPEALEIADPSRVERQLQRINSYFQCTAEVQIDAVLRLPGTYNTKVPIKPVLCELKYLNADFRYSLDDFEAVTLATEIGDDSASATDSGLTNVATVLPHESLPALDEDLEDDSEALHQFMKKEPATIRQPFQSRTRPDFGRAERPAPEEPLSTPLGTLSDFEPLPYEPGEKAAVAPPADRSPVSLDAMADRIADRLVDRLVSRLSDTLVDRIVDELVKRMRPR